MSIAGGTPLAVERALQAGCRVLQIFVKNSNRWEGKTLVDDASIDLIDTVATVRLELDNWTGSRYTDLFTLLKVDGAWKIMNKVFHLHP